jgi:PadR family transcriptional regulator, regulatory protein PadR
MTGPTRRVILTVPTKRVLAVLLAEPTVGWYGYLLMRSARVSSGTLYPMLLRLEAQGLIVSSWESDRPSGRPTRRYYRLTEEGTVFLSELLGGSPTREQPSSDR